MTWVGYLVYMLVCGDLFGGVLLLFGFCCQV